MAGSPPAPKVLRGAFVVKRQTLIESETIGFQFNPESMSRTLNSRTESAQEGMSRPTLEGAPTQTFSLSLILTAADELEQGSAAAARYGVLPQISRLESLIHPDVQVVRQRLQLLTSRLIGPILPNNSPIIIFVWGPNRIMPINITGMTIEEEFYDPNLNPLKATVSVNVEVLTYNDVRLDDPASSMYVAFQKGLKVAKALSQVVGDGVPQASLLLSGGRG